MSPPSTPPPTSPQSILGAFFFGGEEETGLMGGGQRTVTHTKGEWDSDEEDTPPRAEEVKESPLRRLVREVLRHGASVTHASPERAKPKPLLAGSLFVGEEIVTAKCFSALFPHPPGAQRASRRSLLAALTEVENTSGNRDKEDVPHNLPPRRTPHRGVTNSPILARLSVEGNRSGGRAQAKSTKDFMKELITRWVLTDHPTQGCLNFLGIGTSEETTAFVRHYTHLRTERDACIEAATRRLRPALSRTYGTLFTRGVVSHAYPLLLAHREGTAERTLLKIFENNLAWQELVTLIPVAFFQVLERLGMTRTDVQRIIESKNPRALKTLIERLKAKVERGASDAHKLISLLLDPESPKLFLKLFRNLPAPGAPLRAFMGLKYLALTTVISRFLEISPFLSTLDRTLDSVDIRPLIQFLVRRVCPKSGVMSPRLCTLIDEQLHHSYERFRLLQRLYPGFATNLAHILAYQPPHTHAALRDLFVGLASLGATREHVSSRYRSTQAHAHISPEAKREMEWLGRGIYLETGVSPPPSQVVEGAHTLPNPGAFSLDPRKVEEVFKRHGIPVPPLPEEASSGESCIDRDSPLLRSLQRLINDYKNRRVTAEELSRAFDRAFAELTAKDGKHFVWNAYWLVAEVYLHAFSESQYFPAFVNHTHDSWSENKAHLTRALQILVAQAFSQDVRATPLTREDASRALGPLYLETRTRCDAYTMEMYEQFKATGKLFYLVCAWMGLHVAGTVPREG